MLKLATAIGLLFFSVCQVTFAYEIRKKNSWNWELYCDSGQFAGYIIAEKGWYKDSGGYGSSNLGEIIHRIINKAGPYCR